MRYYRLISPFLNPNNRSHFSRFFSTFHRSPQPRLPTNQSWNHTGFARESTSSEKQQDAEVIPTERVSAIVDEVLGFTLIETMDLFELLREKMGIPKGDVPTMMVMMPGMAFGGGGRGGAKGGGAKAAADKVEEKTAFDLKLDGFDAAAKIKIIKEVRTFTDLGLKEAKELVEKVPTLLKKGVPKEEAEKIIAKMKEIGAKVSME